MELHVCEVNNTPFWYKSISQMQADTVILRSGATEKTQNFQSKNIEKIA